MVLLPNGRRPSFFVFSQWNSTNQARDECP
jgi:hypothetical protein